MEQDLLRIGDLVSASGFAFPIEVVEIERVDHPGDKDGDQVTEIPWDMVPDYAVVTLSGNAWRYGDQIRKPTEAELADLAAYRAQEAS